MKHYPELDGVRGIAILAVMLFHFRVFLHIPALAAGWFGVDLFFVLSGYLITGILLNAKEEPRYFRNFYGRRAFRILPLYFTALIVALLALHWMRQTPRPWIVASFWLHVSNWATAEHPNVALITHFWSLSLEEQFYAFWPLVVWLTPRKHLWKVCVAMALTCFGLRNLPWTLQMVQKYPEFVYRLTPFRLDPMLIGAGLASLELPRRHAWMMATVGACIVAIVLLIAGSSPSSEPMTRFGLTGLGLFFGAVVLLRARWMAFGPLRFFGKYSYALYVVHAPLTGLVLHHVGGLKGFLIAFAASITLALLSWHLIEKHFLRLKDRFFASRGLVAQAVPFRATRVNTALAPHSLSE